MKTNNHNLLENPINTTSTDIPKKKKISKLNVREKKLIKYLPRCRTATEAALKAGYSRKTADKIVSRKLGNVEFQSRLHEALEKAGITDERLAKKYNELLEAKKVISANVIMRNGEGMKDADGMTKDFIDVPDNDVQLRTVTTISKLKGHFRNVENGINFEVDNSNHLQNIQINFVEKKSD